MTGNRRLVLATSNPGKVREFSDLLGADWEVIPQSSAKVEPPEETGTTFAANALLKARHASRQTGLSALADDSGIEVDALGGAPGVRSARYAGPAATDLENNAKLLQALTDVPPGKRSARYRCALVFVHGPDDPAPLLAEGIWDGEISVTPRGSGGFGYDPIFIDGESGRTGAELEPAAKQARSHRAKALCALKLLLEREFPAP